jgi:hypothetical protein
LWRLEKSLVLKRLKEIQMQFVRAPVGPGPTKIVEEDNQIYTRIEVNPEFPGGMAKFYKYVEITIES